MKNRAVLFKTTILFFFLLSGFCSLVYEVIWTRSFGLVFGNNTLAVSTVLSAFMLGLGLGAFIIGRYSSNFSNPLKTYGLLEIGIGLFALLIPIGRFLLDPFFFFIYRYFADSLYVLYLIKFAISFLLMFPATFLMGGTLPVLVMTVIRRNENLGKEIGWLYAVNTFGAVLGTLLSGFFLIRLCGMAASIYIAVILNLLIGVLALLLSVRESDQHTVRVTPEPETPGNAGSDSFIFTVFAISGFCALGYETLWNRLLVFMMTNSVYAFTIMLSTFLTGIALGAPIGSRLTHRKNLLFLFGILQFALGVSALLASVGLKFLPQLHDALFVLKPTTSWWEVNLFRMAESFVIMIIPTVLMGVSFPIASRLAVNDFQTRGRNIGKLYFYNTIGGMAGSFAAAFLLIPFMGLSRTLILLVLLNAGAGFYVLLKVQPPITRKIKYAGLITILFLAGCILFISKAFFQPVLSITEKNFQLVDFREGIEGTVTVHEKTERDQTTRRIDVDGLNVAGTSFMLRTLQTLQGHLPLFVNDAAKNVMQIGFGTGQTSHCALNHNLDRFRVIEISEDVLDLSGIYFKSVNQDVFKNPKFDYTISDGKNFVKYTNQSFDVIMNDANYAVATGSASLFTKEHFENGRAKLNENGILSTWMTTDLDPHDFRIVLKTFRSVFPHCLLWMAPNCINKQVVLMGSITPFTLDLDVWKRLLDEEAIRNDLHEVNINSAYDLLTCLVLDEAGMDAFTMDAPVNTDERPLLEFSTRAVRARDFCAYQNLADILNNLPDLQKYVVTSPADSSQRPALDQTLHKYSMARRELLNGMLLFYQGRTQEAMSMLLNGARIIPQSDIGRYYFEMMDVLTDQLTQKINVDPADLSANLEFIRHQIGMGQNGYALRMIKNNLKSLPNHPGLLYELGRSYLAEGHPDSAQTAFQEAIENGQSTPAIYYYLGMLHIRLDDDVQAETDFRRALQLDPRLFEAQNGLAGIFQKRGRYEDAIRFYKSSLAISAYQPQVYSRMGDCYLGLNDLDLAIFNYQIAVRQSWNDAHTFLNLANSFHLKRDLKNAIFYYRESLKLDPDNAEIYYNLGNTLASGGDFSRAIAAFRKAIELNQDSEDYYNNLAMSYRADGQINKALQVFEQALERFKKSKQLHSNARETREILSNRNIK